MEHLLYAEDKVSCPVLAWEPLRKIVLEVDLAGLGVHKWMEDVAWLQELSSWPRLGITDREINLKLQNSTLIQALLDKVNAMPSSQAVIRSCLQALKSARTGRQHKHANNGVLLQQAVIQLQNLIPCHDLLLHLNLLLKLELLWTWNLGSHVFGSSFLVRLEVLKELLQSFRHLVFVLLVVSLRFLIVILIHILTILFPNYL